MAVFPNENGTPTLYPTHRDRRTASKAAIVPGETESSERLQLLSGKDGGKGEGVTRSPHLPY